MNSKKPILVTGSHRSGTTWVGRMIAESPLVGYIHEPLNPNRPGGTPGFKSHHLFPYISSENESIFYDYIKNALSFPYNLAIPHFKTIRRPTNILNVLRAYGGFFKYRILNVRPLLKEPTGVFSAGWLASTFHMDVIVLIRHPAAFASSVKRLRWGFSLSHFLDQPLLIRDHLYPFVDEIRVFEDRNHDIIDHAALVWKLIYHTVAKYQKEHDDWIFIRHEDLSRDPLTGFENIFKRLNLEYSKHVNEAIRKHTDSTNTSEAPFSIMRDSKSHIWAWKSRLTESEIERIRAKVEDISRIFYSDEDW